MSDFIFNHIFNYQHAVTEKEKERFDKDILTDIVNQEMSVELANFIVRKTKPAIIEEKDYVEIYKKKLYAFDEQDFKKYLLKKEAEILLRYLRGTGIEERFDEIEKELKA